MIDNNNNENNDIYNIVEVISIVCIPYITEKSAMNVLDFLQKLIILFESKGKNDNNYFFKFIKHCIISYFDSTFIKPGITTFFVELLKLINKIFSDDEFIHYFKYIS